MTRRNLSPRTLSRILAVAMGLIFLAACGGGGGGGGTTTPTSPAITLSPTTLTFTSETVGTPSAAQPVTVTDSGTATLVFSSITITGTNAGDFAETNTCGTSVAAGANCTISVTFTPSASGSRSGTLSITDNASGSPHTVSLSGTGSASTVSLSTSTLAFATQIMVDTPSAAMPVTLNNTGTAALAIASIVPSGDFSETNNCGTSVNGSGSCTVNVTFTPTAAGARTGTLTITDNSNGVAGTTQTVALSGSGFTGNSVAVDVNFGPNGPGSVTATSSPYFNGIFATVTVCEPGTTTCTNVPNVLVDTGSVGLRVLATALTGVTLQSITNSGEVLNECVEYGDMSYTWGPVQMATVQISGETASQVPASEGGTANQGIPIQTISNTSNPPTGAQCLSGGGVNDNTVVTLGANGILGVGNYTTDCGSACADASPPSNSPYIACSTTSCTIPSVALGAQVWNPVSAFASADTNGVQVQLPSIPAAGAATVAGTLVFGVGTETCPGSPAGCTPNGLGSTQVFALDGYGNLPTITYNGITYSSPNNASYFDTGSNALYILDEGTLNTTDCIVSNTNIGYYCPGGTLTLTNIGLAGFNGVGSGNTSLNVANALALFANNPSFAAFNDLAGESGGSSSADDTWDFGLPFFFGRDVFIGIMGSNPPNGKSAPNGYWAF